MTDAELELYIYRILSGIIIFYYNGEKYELRSPSPIIRYEANLIYDNIINNEKYGDWIREENIIFAMISLGLWDKEVPDMIKKLEKKIEDQKVELYKSAIMPDRNKMVRAKLNSNKRALNQLISAKNDFFANTLEGYASSIKNEFIICKTVYKNNKLVFDTKIENNESSLSVFNSITNIINKYIISVSQFKIIARSSLWRSYWNTNKGSIFKGTVGDWTDDQRTLVNITNMYDSVYGHPECPADNIVEDEDMLDGWMIFQRRKIEKQKNINKIDELDPKLKNAQEVFLMTNKEMTYDDIMSLNSDESKRRIQEKIEFVNNKGLVAESQLPDIQRDLLVRSDELRKNRK